MNDLPRGIRKNQDVDDAGKDEHMEHVPLPINLRCLTNLHSEAEEPEKESNKPPNGMAQSHL